MSATSSHPFFQSCFFPLLLSSGQCCDRNACRVWAACLQSVVLPRESLTRLMWSWIMQGAGHCLHWRPWMQVLTTTSNAHEVPSRMVTEMLTACYPCENAKACLASEAGQGSHSSQPYWYIRRVLVLSSVTSVHNDENNNACLSFTHSAKVRSFNLPFLFPSPTILISHLNVNKYKDLLCLIVEDSQEVREKEGGKLYVL